MRLPRLFLTLGSAVALAAVFAQSAFADPRDFYLNNNSAVDLAQVYVSPTDMSSWGDDILGTQILPSGQQATVTFKNFDGATCLFDIKVVGQQGQEGYIYKVDLCSVTNVNFS